MSFDVIVIGLGAMGSAAAFQLAKKKVKILGIDQFSPPHKFGSTHGDTRVTRQAIGEGIEFVPLTLRSYEIWREIEAETAADLLTVTGGLIMSSAGGNNALHGSGKFIEETVNCAKKFGIEHRILSAAEIAEAFPQFNLIGDEIGYFETNAGFLRPENCVTTQLDLAKKFGAEIHTSEKVLDIRQQTNAVEVITDKNRYSAEKVVISVGAWIKNFVGETQKDLFKIYRQVLFWFDAADAFENYKLGNFPVFIWEFGRWQNDFVYGFPAIDGRNGGLKVATETYFSTTEPNKVKREVSAEETKEVFERYIENRILGIKSKCVKAVVCLYTMTSDSRFVIDNLTENITVASPCSGHGFKHSAAIGEILSELATVGKSKIDISKFSLDRFCNASVEN